MPNFRSKTYFIVQKDLQIRKWRAIYIGMYRVIQKEPSILGYPRENCIVLTANFELSFWQLLMQFDAKFLLATHLFLFTPGRLNASNQMQQFRTVRTDRPPSQILEVKLTLY